MSESIIAWANRKRKKAKETGNECDCCLLQGERCVNCGEIPIGYRVLRMRTIPVRPRKHVDSVVVESKQIKGEK